MATSLEQLCRRLGYVFIQPDLLQQALTHRSVSSHNNERLEFLGDALVNFIIAEVLYGQFPYSREGELTRLRAKLVRGETLALIAKELDIGSFLQLSVGELKSGGHERNSILADALEGIIGAMYLDAGFDITRAKVLSWYQNRLADPDIFSQLKDPKTRLQEWLQSKKLPLPDYEVVTVTGEAHAQTFEIKCSVQGISLVTMGIDTNRRGAEQKAASDYLSIIQEKMNDE